MPEWVGAALKLLGSAGSAFFGILALGTKARDEAGKMTRQGYVALVGIIVSALLASASTIYDYSSSTSKDKQSLARNEQTKLDTLRLKYPLRGVTAEVVVEFPHDFPALTAYKAKLSAALPKKAKECKNNKVFECMDSDDDGILYGIPATSPLFPKAADPMRRVLERVSVSVGFVKPGHGFGDSLPFHPIGNFSFKPAQSSTKAMIEYQPGSGHFDFYVSDIKIPDEVVIRSGLYSLADVFPGVMTADAIVTNFPPICELANVSAQKACETQIPYTDLRFVRVYNLGLQFPYPKKLGVDALSWNKCTSTDMGDTLIRALPDDIEKIDEVGNTLPPIDQTAHIKGLCEAMNSPEF